MSRRRLTVITAAVTVGLGSAAAFAGLNGPVPPVQAGATPTLVKVPVRVSSYAVYDHRGHRIGKADWRISTAGGNCCETYVTATRSGRVVESGGTYPWYTDDRGKHWYQVKFAIPDQNDNGPAIAGGEGATVVGPHDDVYGVTWDAYSGDHFMAYKYSAQKGSWAYAEIPMHSPFYDRPWLAYAKGAFTLSGTKSQQILDASGGGITKDIDELSPDGIDYGNVSAPYNDEQQSTATKLRIKTVRNQDADWWQPYPWTGELALNAGGLLRFGTTEDITGSKSCPVARLAADSSWQCVKLAGTFRGVVRQDSRGYLVEVSTLPGYAGFTLSTSRDGGLHWSSTTLKPPPGTGSRLETPDLFNVMANGALRQAVVSARFDDAKGNGHDMVFRVDTSRTRPRLLKTYLVGKGDLNTANDVTGSAGYRYDYESVALLPDGKIAISFDDSTCLQPTLRDPTHRAPEVAILL